MEKKFDGIFRANYKKLVSVSYGYTKKRELAEEAVQDVFLDFWNRLERKEAILNSEAYLRRAVVYRSLDYIKKERRYSDTENNDLELLADKDNVQSPESLIVDREDKAALQKAINSLADRTREVFMLSRFEKNSHNEISNKLEISKKTVEYHITKALTQLREALISLIIVTFSFFI